MMGECGKYRHRKLNKAVIIQDIIPRIGKWDCIKLKSFCIGKETVTRMVIQIREWEKNLCQLFIS
jgi:hypothetical protein